MPVGCRKSQLCQLMWVTNKCGELSHTSCPMLESLSVFPPVTLIPPGIDWGANDLTGENEFEDV